MNSAMPPPAANDAEHPAVAEFAPSFIDLDADALNAVLATVTGLLIHKQGPALTARVLGVLHAQALHSGRAALDPFRSSRIIAEVAAKYGLTLDELRGPSHRPREAHPRQEAMFRLRQETTLSYPEIARRLGRTDHSTAMHACRAHLARMAASPA